ncbi:C45 family autoproteolytic acyltransferase/hydolase [Paenibacillus thalictri]|uniref:Peptidase C45 hydrolase domain-containing protein n=1 Tax=Paenibacillus thalictri TaxID=2527873 RepID=A0A4Q9DQ52_9BACL|nr:C45 family peptidase [Paenibacillus thalictri]TBL76381.1 hypothetical protein EYB31_20565 [Paenibacillus thalictri]
MTDPYQEALQQQSRSNETFPFYKFSGTHREIGRQYGEACCDLIKKHRDLAIRRLKADRLPRELLHETILRYRAFVQKYAPYFDEEVEGISEGAGISVADAYLLQIRAEIDNEMKKYTECTTFAVLPEATSDGTGIIGQNADLPAFYKEVGVVVEFVPDDGHAHLVLTPAGQISYIGINSNGMGVFANFLTCDGWKAGFPRYMFSRYALYCDSVSEAIEALRGLERASSRNLIMMDKYGNAVDMENTPERDGLILPEQGILAHSNHYTLPSFAGEEKLTGTELENSRARQDRMQQLLTDNRGKLNASLMKSLLRDRETYPYPLCRMPGDGANGAPDYDIITFASVIAEPSKGQMWVALGPPNQYEYKLYSFTS